MHPAALDPDQLIRRCEVRRTRGSGPGGQRRNKVETAIVLHDRPTGITAQAGERRSQAENQKIALSRLRLKLALDVRTTPDPHSTPSELWRGRVRGGRIQINPRHSDFAPLLAEALDVLGVHGGDVGAAAEKLGCSKSQLMKLLRIQPRALELLNQHRRERNLRPLR